MNIAELVATLGIDLDGASFDATKAAIQVVTKQLRMMAIEAELASKKMNTALASATIGLPGMGGDEGGGKKGGIGAWLGNIANINQATELFGKLKHSISHTISHTIHLGAEMDGLADKTGLAVEQVQEFGYAAGIHGISAGSMANTLNKLSITLGKAAKNGGEIAEPFKKAGIAIKDAEGKARPAADVLLDIADRMESLSEEERPAEAMKLLGKQGKDMIGFLKEGSAGIEKLRQEARDMGLVMSKDTVGALDKVEKNTKRLGKAWEGIKEHAIIGLVPAIQSLTDSLLAWYHAHKEDIAHAVHAGFAVLFVAVKVLIKAFQVLIKVITFVIKSWKAMLVILGSLALAYVIVERKAVMAGLASFKAGVLAAKGWLIASAPLLAITALIAGVILLVQDMYVWLKGGKSLMGEMFGPADDNAFIQGIKKVFAFMGDIINAIVKRIEWVVDKAKEAWSWITDSPMDTIRKDENFQKLREQGVSEDQAIIQTVTGPRPTVTAPSGAGAAGATVNSNVTNTFNINGGDPNQVRQVIREELDTDRRRLEATLGGAK